PHYVPAFQYPSLADPFRPTSLSATPPLLPLVRRLPDPHHLDRPRANVQPQQVRFRTKSKHRSPFLSAAQLVCCASSNDALNLFQIRRRIQSPIPPIAWWRRDQTFALPAIERRLRDIKQVTYFKGGEPP